MLPGTHSSTGMFSGLLLAGLRLVIHLSQNKQKWSRNAKNKKCTVGNFTLLFSHFGSLFAHCNSHRARKFEGRLYTYCILHFTDILRNTKRNTKHPQYTFCISFKFRVHKKINYEILFTFAKCEKSAAKYLAIRFLFFAFWEHFMQFREKCKVRVATMTHDHDDTPHAILTLLVVPAGKWVNL